jgi:glutathione S-transferase
MGRIERVLGTEGFAVGSKLSLADVLLYNTFADYLRDEEANADLPSFRRYPFASKERMDTSLAAHPRIQASVNAVASNENIKGWRCVVFRCFK